jgi:hypothetical protein
VIQWATRQIFRGGDKGREYHETMESQCIMIVREEALMYDS